MKYTAEMIDFLREKARETSDRGEITRLFNERFGTNKKKKTINGVLLQLGEKADRKYTPEMIAFLRKEDGNCRSREELTRLFNEKFGTQKTPTNIYDILWRHGIQAHRRFCYTKEMDDFICHHYGMTYSELAKLFNKKFKTNKTGYAVGRRCRELGLRCSEEIVCKANQRYRQDELDLVCAKLPYIKTTGELVHLLNKRFHDRKYDIYHLVKKYFPDSAKRICAGKVFIYCDRNKKNNSPDNMEIMTRGEFQSLVRIGMYSEEPEVTKAGIALVRLTRRLKELQKRKRTN